MKRMAISELEGVALAYAVGKADGRKLWIAEGNRPEHMLRDKVSRECFYPVGNWSQCGPLIERYGLTVRPHCTANDVVTSWCADYVWPVTRNCPSYCASSPLTAACRAIVAAHNPSGFVEVPDELVEQE